MPDKTRPYLYYDFTRSICATCMRQVDAKIVIEDDRVYMDKRCPEHGPQRVLIADDAAYYRASRERYIKPPEMPLKYQTPVTWGCPYDCGLCVDHEQHSCLALVEVTDRCNLECPVCYAASGPTNGRHRTMEEITGMLDTIVASEGEADVVQISGGEPTIHPDFFRILDEAKTRPIKHLMINTNGVRIANEDGFAARLAEYMPGLEIYLQFDSLREEAHLDLRGGDLRDVRRKALENLEAAGVSTTLVVTLRKGLNDDEVGAIIDHALSWKCVRGVTFQPIQVAGRLEQYDEAKDRLTLTEVRRRILEQTDVFTAEDVVPVPCHPDGLAMAYAIRGPDGPVPLTGIVGPDALLAGPRNTIVFEHDDAVKERFIRLFTTGNTPEVDAARLGELLCCLPMVQRPEGIGYRDIFRVIIMQFMDAHSLDVRAVKKACVTIATTDGRLVPFDTYNLLYRGRLEAEVLAPLRAEVGPSPEVIINA